MKKILIILFLLANILYSKEIIIDSDLDNEYIKNLLPNITAENQKSKIKKINERYKRNKNTKYKPNNKVNYSRLGYLYSIGSLSEDSDKYVHANSLYISRIYKNIGLGLVTKSHSSNLTYDVFGYGLNYHAPNNAVIISINIINGKGNDKDISGIDTNFIILTKNSSVSFGYDSILKKFNIGFGISFKVFSDE